MEEALRKGLERAEKIYHLAMKSGDYKAAIEATTVVMSTEGTLTKFAKTEELFDEVQDASKIEYEKALSSKK